MTNTNAGIYDYKVNLINGKEIKLDTYKGKTLLITNIATQCGYTPQLDDLEKLYKRYSEQGLIVLGVPSNDFGAQTPEENEEVAKFCKLRYGVTFPLAKKTVVKGDNKSELFKYLTSLSKNEIKWNFEKFLFDKDGKFLGAFSSKDTPLDSNIETLVKKNL